MPRIKSPPEHEVSPTPRRGAAKPAKTRLLTAFFRARVGHTASSPGPQAMPSFRGSEKICPKTMISHSSDCWGSERCYDPPGRLPHSISGLRGPAEPPSHQDPISYSLGIPFYLTRPNTIFGPGAQSLTPQL
jgi:hypothetical protein